MFLRLPITTTLHYELFCYNITHFMHDDYADFVSMYFVFLLFCLLSTKHTTEEMKKEQKEKNRSSASVVVFLKVILISTSSAKTAFRASLASD